MTNPVPVVITNPEISPNTDVSFAGTGLLGHAGGKATSVDAGQFATDAELATGLATKANSVHTHVISDVTNLQSSLDAKLNANDPSVTNARTPLPHTHATSEITGLDALLTNFRPVVLTQPLAASGNVGDSLSISCLGGILPNTHLNLTYQWQLSTDAGVSYSNITGATSPSIPFNPALFGQNGLYRCRLGNAFGTQDTNAVALTIDNSIRHIYGVNDRGVAWDLDRMDHLFQGNTGGVPVSAYGDPVGLILTRERGGLDNIGPRREVNGDFATDLSGWTNIGGASATWSNGAMRITSGTTFGGRTQVVTGITTRMIEFRCLARCVTPPSSGSGRILVYPHGNGLVVPEVAIVAPIPVSATLVEYRRYIVMEPGHSSLTIYLAASTNSPGAEWEIDSVSVREVPGSHLTQPTSSRRPTYARRPKSGVRNLLQRNRQFENAYWGKTNISSITVDDVTESSPLGGHPDRVVESTDVANTNHQLFLNSAFSFTSGLTYTWSIYAKRNGRDIRLSFPSAAFSGGPTVFFNLANGTIISGSGGAITALANGWYRCSITATATATASNQFLTAGPSNEGTRDYIGNGSSGIWVDGAQLEVGSLTNLQVVTNQFDVTESGQPSINYLWFDGIDDCLQSATAIDFSNSDEMTISLGQRKLNDASQRNIIGLGAGIDTDNGTIQLTAPNGASTSYAMRSRGTSIATAETTAFAQPDVCVLTGQANISDDLCTLRRNQTQVATSSTDQGTGNFANAVLHVGSRAGSSLFFQGHLNSGFIINRILNPAILADYERHWVAAKAGIDLP